MNRRGFFSALFGAPVAGAVAVRQVMAEPLPLAKLPTKLPDIAPFPSAPLRYCMSGAWGRGGGSLTPYEVDRNFYTIWCALQDRSDPDGKLEQ